MRSIFRGGHSFDLPSQHNTRIANHSQIGTLVGVPEPNARLVVMVLPLPLPDVVNPPTVNIIFTHGQIVGTHQSFAVSQT